METLVLRNSMVRGLVAASLLMVLARQAHGQIFVANTDANTVGEYTASGATVNAALISGLDYPWAVAADGHGHLFVANYYLGTIGEYTTSGATVDASLITGLNFPWSITLDGAGHLFVANNNYQSTVGEYTTSGETVNAALISGLNWPTGIVADRKGHLFVETYDDGTIGEYTTSGATVNVALVTGLESAVELALDGDGHLFVANVVSGTIGEYTTSGETINPELISGLDHPYGIALDGKGHLYVANEGSGTIGEYTTSGATVNAALISGLSAPWSVVFDVPVVVPVITCPANSTVECGSASTVMAQVADPDGENLTVVWTLNGTVVQTNLVPGSTSAAGTNVSFSAVLPLGSNMVAVTVSDTAGNSASCSRTVAVVDATPPVIESVTASPDVLWPPNHRMVAVAVDAVVTDECGPANWKIVGVSSNEAENARGSGHTSPDWQITGDHAVLLRAERSGTGIARVYTIAIEATDASGHSSQSTVTVTVPHDRGKRRTTGEGAR
jgi:hypothetical protein